tara:strand:- start:43 stop:264 length:222 start_codon:yes stop_codon:yes gene_type:complete
MLPGLLYGADLKSNEKGFGFIVCDDKDLDLGHDTTGRCLSIILQLKAEDAKVSQKMKLSNFQSKSKKMEDIEP